MILVTGAAGYIGSHFVRKYLSAQPNSAVLAIDNLSTGHRQALKEDARLIFRQQDIGDLDAMQKLMHEHRVEAVVHFAANCYVGESEQDPFKYLNNNVAKTIKLFEAMTACNVKRIVFSSSCATYGNPEFMPLTEVHKQSPINVYGQTKHLTEQILFSLSRTSGLSFVALRYFNASGADDSMEIGESHDPETHLLPNVLRVASGKLPHIEIFGDDYDTRDGTCIRDYVHVNDLADAHIAALKLTEKQTAVGINLGTGHGASVKEVIDVCSQISGSQIKSIVSPRRPGDPAVLVADYAKAKEMLNWTPKYDLKKIVETAWSWEKNRRY
jgi:UDP-glucose 4-epimerase